MVLHELKHVRPVRVSSVKEGNAMGGDFSVDGGKPTKNDIIVHKQSEVVFLQYKHREQQTSVDHFGT
jgi:hypothetical protein